MRNATLSKIFRLSFKQLGDTRGKLISTESNVNIPFNIKRVYYMYNTVIGAERGFHAHIDLQQVAICTSGSCKIDLEYANGNESFILDSPEIGLYMGGLVWSEIRDFSDDCVLMLLADELYSEEDYVRDYQEFKIQLHNLRSHLLLKAT